MANRKKKIGNKAQTSELGLKGRGVEPLVIQAIESAAKKFLKAHDETAVYAEVEDEVMESLLNVMHEHREELVPEFNKDGLKVGVSYRFGETLVTLKSSSEKVSVKSIHDNPPDIQEAE